LNACLKPLHTLDLVKSASVVFQEHDSQLAHSWLLHAQLHGLGLHEARKAELVESLSLLEPQLELLFKVIGVSDPHARDRGRYPSLDLALGAVADGQEGASLIHLVAKRLHLTLR